MSGLNGRKIEAMHRLYGKRPGERCCECPHFLSGEWRDRVHHKCRMYGLSHSEATDWRLSWTACGMMGMTPEVGALPVIDRLKREPKPSADAPIEGQITMTELLEVDGT